MFEADYIVVLDTGSTDGTYEAFQKLAVKFPNKVIVAQEIIENWRFDTARNISMSYIPDAANILFSVDLNEVLVSNWSKTIRENWTDSIQRGVYKYAWSHTASGLDGKVILCTNLHTKNWLWRYPIHESLFNIETNSEEYLADNSIFFEDVYIHHFPDTQKAKPDYLYLYKQRVSERDNDFMGKIYLAHEYYYQQDYDLCISYLNNLLSAKIIHEPLLISNCYLFIGDSLAKKKDLDNAIISYKYAIEADPTYREPYFSLAQALIDNEDYKSALEYTQSGIKNSFRKYS